MDWIVALVSLGLAGFFTLLLACNWLRMGLLFGKSDREDRDRASARKP